ncbi:MAG: SPOR domain-containing protein [Nitrospirae bacterium]|nr:SPOR domain-containing protein [Nitrospirota bacterium]MBF0539937.1 SPOR domain-containing protein [Nitrospirota bacterium]
MADKSVIIIDDEFMKTKDLGQLLITDGYNVRVAGSKDEAVEMTVKMMPSLIMIKAILIDASEFDIIRGLRSLEALKAIPIVMITESEEDYNDISVISKYKPDYGIIKVIQIPIDAEEFLSTIKSITNNIDIETKLQQFDNSVNSHREPQEDKIQEGFYDTLQENIEGERKNMAEKKDRKIEIDEENDPRIHYEENDFSEVSENESKSASSKLSGIAEMLKSKKMLPILMVGIVVIIFASLIITKITQKHNKEKDKSAESGREILTIVEPPDKKPLSPTDNNAATLLSQNKPSIKEPAKNELPEKPTAQEKAVPEQIVKPEETAKPEEKPANKIENKANQEEKVKPEEAVKPAVTQTKPPVKVEEKIAAKKPAPVEEKPAQKSEPKAAHKKTVTKKTETAKKTIQKPTKPSHSPKSETTAKTEAKAEIKEKTSTPEVTAKQKPVHQNTKSPVSKAKEQVSTKNEEKTVKSEEKSTQTYKVQVGVFNNSANAISILNKLQADNYQGEIKEIHKKDKTIYLVTTGKFNTKKEATATALRLKTVHKIDAIVIK